MSVGDPAAKRQLPFGPWQLLWNVKAIHGAIKNALVVADIDKKILDVERRIRTDRKRIRLLKH